MTEEHVLLGAAVLLFVGLVALGWWLSRPPRPRRGGLYGREWGR